MKTLTFQGTYAPDSLLNNELVLTLMAEAGYDIVAVNEEEPYSIQVEFHTPQRVDALDLAHLTSDLDEAFVTALHAADEPLWSDFVVSYGELVYVLEIPE